MARGGESLARGGAHTATWQLNHTILTFTVKVILKAMIHTFFLESGFRVVIFFYLRWEDFSGADWLDLLLCNCLQDCAFPVSLKGNCLEIFCKVVSYIHAGFCSSSDSPEIIRLVSLSLFVVNCFYMINCTTLKKLAISLSCKKVVQYLW